MDRSDAFIIYVAASVAVINAGLELGGVKSIGVYLGLYTLSYLPASWYARPRGRRAVLAIAVLLAAAFIVYSALKVV